VATDSLNALVNFFRNYSEYAKNDFWLAGESYAGKYIPDLAVQIDKYNRLTPTATFKLKGQLVGNGVMTFEGGDIQISQTTSLSIRSYTNIGRNHVSLILIRPVVDSSASGLMIMSGKLTLTVSMTFATQTTHSRRRTCS
jgi:hypothetical protein